MMTAAAAAAAAKSLQSCPTLCDPIDGSPPGSSVPGIFQARVLEWVAIAFSDYDSGSRKSIWQTIMTGETRDEYGFYLNGSHRDTQGGEISGYFLQVEEVGF